MLRILSWNVQHVYQHNGQEKVKTLFSTQLPENIYESGFSESNKLSISPTYSHTLKLPKYHFNILSRHTQLCPSVRLSGCGPVALFLLKFTANKFTLSRKAKSQNLSSTKCTDHSPTGKLIITKIIPVFGECGKQRLRPVLADPERVGWGGVGGFLKCDLCATRERHMAVKREWRTAPWTVPSGLSGSRF